MHPARPFPLLASRVGLNLYWAKPATQILETAVNPIHNLDRAENRPVPNSDISEARLAPLAERLGGRDIGANVTTVPPGKAAFPLLHHHGNEEHFFVISGTGVLRLGAATHAVKPGDYIVTPPGGAELAHQLVNTGAADLVYLALSTKPLPEGGA